MELYQKQKVLGTGSFGKAILVRRATDKQLFVMKEVNLARMKEREREEARNECKVLQLLHHPNVIRYEEHFEKRNVLYIIMEYADGGDLHQKIMNQRNNLMREDTVLHYFVQMCLALDYLHSRHILHRDIKAMNIFLTSNGTVKLGDFGISTILRNTMGMANTVCGTPYYFSPELCKNKPYNNKTDVWALGVVLFEMLSLKHPFDASNLNQLMQRILKTPTPGVPSIYSPHVRELVFWCLEKDHKSRPSVRSLLQKDVTKRALLRLQGDLGQAAGTNQRLQQVVADRIADAARTNAPPPPLAAPVDINAAAKAQAEAKAQLQIQQMQQQQQRRPSPQPQLQPRVSPQQPPLALVQNPVIAVHAQKDVRIGGAAAPAAAAAAALPPPKDPFRPLVNVVDARRISPTPSVAVQPGLLQNNNININNLVNRNVAVPAAVAPPSPSIAAAPALPPPPRQAQQQLPPPRSLAERMAEMEKQRAARIQQLERERREAEERERSDVEEARRAAQARVHQQRQRQVEAQEQAAARDREEREARRKRRLPSLPREEHEQQLSHMAAAQQKKPAPQQQQQHQQQQQAVAVRPSGGVAGALGFGGQAQPQQQPQQQQQQQPRRGSPQPISGRPAEDRPAVSNAYLAHLRDHQAQRGGGGGQQQQQQRQAAGDWVEQQQQRRLSGQAIVVPFLQQQQPPAQQRLDRDVEKWLAEEQKKRWHENNNKIGGAPAGAGAPESARQQQQQRPMLPPHHLQPLPNVGGSGAAAVPAAIVPGAGGLRPKTPPPSPTQAALRGPKRKHGAVDPLPDDNNNNNQQQNAHRRGSAPEMDNVYPARKLSMDVIEFAKNKPGGGCAPANNNANRVAPRPLDAQLFAAQQQQQQQQLRHRRDHSAPPIISPMRIAPCNIAPCESAEELAGDSSSELVPVRSSDMASGGMQRNPSGGGGGGGAMPLECDDNLSEVDDVEAHEAMVAEQGEIEERRVREYTAMGWHIKSLLEAPVKENNNNNKNNNNNNNNNKNGPQQQQPDDFQEDQLEEESTDGTLDDDEDSSDSGMLDAQTDFVNNNNNNNNVKALRPPPDAQAETNPPQLRQQQQQKPLNDNRNGNVISNHQHHHHQQQQQQRPTFPLLHLCGGVAFSRWWQSVENTAEEAASLRAALIRRLKVKEVVSQLVQLLNMACTSVNGSNGSLAVNMYKMVEPFVGQVRKVVKTHVAKTKLLGQVDDDVVECFVDEIVQTASRIVFFEGYTNNNNNNNNNNNAAAVAAGGAVGTPTTAAIAVGGRR